MKDLFNQLNAIETVGVAFMAVLVVGFAIAVLGEIYERINSVAS